MIRLLEVTKIFHRNRPDEYVALDGVDLAIARNGMVVFKGPSGSGKTTLLSIVGCMARPTQGRVIVDDREVTSLPERFLADIRRRTFGFVFQQLHLMRGISVLENVMIPAFPVGEKRAPLQDRARHLLEVLGIGAKARAKVEYLSGGEAQRVAIARALINDPAVIIADEPTAHLDTKRSLDLMQIMERLRGEGKTIIFASHDPLICESGLISRVYEMRDGRILSGERRAGSIG